MTVSAEKNETKRLITNDEQAVQNLNIWPAEVRTRVWVLYPKAETTVEKLLEPRFHALMGRLYNPGDRIEVMHEHRAWWAELLVIDSGPDYARVHLLRKVDLPAADAGQLPTGWQLVYVGGQRWVAKQNGEIRKGGFVTKAEAIEWIAAYRSK